MKRRILFTGGGSAGHVTVNMALIPIFLQAGWEVYYIGSRHGIEAELAGRLPDVRYIGIATGKLRRYFDWRNVTDPLRVLKGCYEAYRTIRQIKPAVLFSKGGFVSVPVVIGAWLNKLPVVIHESDLTPGLANRIAIPFADKVCTTFPETAEHLPKRKAEPVGAVVRAELSEGNAERGLALCGFTPGKPVMLVMGGSLGSQKINAVVRRSLNRLLDNFHIIHICGKGQLDLAFRSEGYRQFEYLHEELPHIMAAADIVVSRAGSNAIFEFLSLHKPMLLIPLSGKASRGDQIANAGSFERQGFCELLLEENLTDDTFVSSVRRLYDHRLAIAQRMARVRREDTIGKLADVIVRNAR